MQVGLHSKRAQGFSAFRPRDFVSGTMLVPVLILYRYGISIVDSSTDHSFKKIKNRDDDVVPERD